MADADIMKFTVTGKPEYRKVLRMAIGSLAGHMGFDVEEIDDIKVAVEEACKLITCHGFKEWTNAYEVECLIEENKMTITMSDSQLGREIKKSYRTCQNCPQEGDMAVILIKTLMDDLEIKAGDDGNKSIVMVKNKC